MTHCKKKRRKKYGILTYHHVVNIGSILQAWAGYQFLAAKLPDADVEFINYYPQVSREHNRSKIIKNGLRRLDIHEVLKQRCFMKYLSSRCKIGRRQVPDVSLALGVEVIQDLGYDAVFVGSDTVFQLNGYFGELIAGPPAPNLYFLPGLTSCPKIGFAASCDPLSPDVGLAGLDAVSAKSLREFAAIGFRDDDTRRLLVAAGCDMQKSVFIPDPTILAAKEVLMEFGNGHRSNGPPEAIGVYVGHNRASNEISRHLRSLGYRPIDLRTGALHLNSKRMFLNFIQPLRGIAGLVTDRFHGTILASILGDYPVIGLVDVERYPVGGKMRDLYQRLRMLDNLIPVRFEQIDLDAIAAQLSEAILHHRKQRMLPVPLQELSSYGAEQFKSLVGAIA